MKKIITITFLVMMVISLFGCGTDPKSHSTKFSDAKGKWQLDSIYEDTVSKPIGKRTSVTMELDDSQMVVTKVTKKDTSTKTYTVEKGNKEFSISGEGENITYTFNYDPGAKVLHLYYEKDGKVIHEVYDVYSEKKQLEQEENEGQEAMVKTIVLG